MTSVGDWRGENINRPRVLLINARVSLRSIVSARARARAINRNRNREQFAHFYRYTGICETKLRAKSGVGAGFQRAAGPPIVARCQSSELIRAIFPSRPRLTACVPDSIGSRRRAPHSRIARVTPLANQLARPDLLFKSSSAFGY